ncbi:Uma2 family endonuclease [Argonema galeatum]|uniref:Uma2 family endonuclease n=1 Tax=Argonema galeatum TaxID=2942762 RepID=UPI002012AD5F|nr:Uma2 family endonuclease [Argonema galeatum]MCL1467914.1 Uma2 family endonuclease [Argonema galeatum A003/A1]
MVSSVESPTKISLEEFLQLPETQPASEYINGQIYQKPMPQGEHSILQSELASSINQMGKPQKLAYAFPELRCTFGGGAVVPDVTVFEWSRIPRKANGRIENRFNIAPDWTIEILSPEQSANRVIRKIIFCLKHGTQLGWLIDPEDESVMIFQPNQTPDVKYNDEILPVLSVLGDWQLSGADLFSWLVV